MGVLSKDWDERVIEAETSRRDVRVPAAKAASAGLDNVHAAVASAVSLPLVDEAADVVVSNYCFHHLSDPDKRHALRETHRVLGPGGRLVFGDMMFARPSTTPVIVRCCRAR